MEWSRIERHWATHFRERAARRWTRLSERQLEETGGRRIALAMALQHVYCMSPERADAQVREWLAQQEEPVEAK